MDIASVFGLIFGIGCILFGYGMDGGNVRSLWMLSAMIITLGGSIGPYFCYGIDRFNIGLCLNYWSPNHDKQQ